jgi:hypothetical protein
MTELRVFHRGTLRADRLVLAAAALFVFGAGPILEASGRPEEEAAV